MKYRAKRGISSSSLLRRAVYGFHLLLVMAILATTTSTALASSGKVAQTGSLSQAATTRDIEVGELYNQQPMRLNGISDRRSVWLNLPSNLVLNAGSYMEVKLGHSPLLIPENSHLTLLLNNQPVSSIRLDASNQQDGSWRVNFPASLQPDRGVLQVSFAASMRLNNLECPPGDDRSSWVTIAPSSRLHLEYNMQPLSSLADVPQTLFSSRFMTDRRVTVVVPENPSKRDLARASQVLARLGKLAGGEGSQVSLSYGPGSNNAAHQILVGGPALFPVLSNLNLPLPLSGQSFNSNGQPVAAEVGVLQVAAPASNRPVGGARVVLSGGSDDAADRAVQAFLDESTLGLMRGSYGLVQPNSQFKPTPVLNKNTTATVANGRNSFPSLGLENSTVYGLGTQDINYSFALPPYHNVNGDGQFSLAYSFAGAVDRQRSSMSVILNDVPLQSVQLNPSVPISATKPLSAPDASSLQAYRLNVSLPREVLRNDSNRLTMRFAMYAQTRCGETVDFNDIWGAAYTTSELDVAIMPGSEKTPTLAQLPQPFNSDQGNTLVVLPENPAPAHLNLAAQMVAELGRYEGDNQFNRISLISTKDVSQNELGQANLVVVGTPDNNNVLRDLNAKLPVAWNSNTARTLNTAWGLRYASDDNGLAGLMQIVTSPWNEQKVALALLAQPLPGSDGEGLAMAFARGMQVGKHKGNLMALDRQGRTYNVATFEQKPAPTATPATTAAASITTAAASPAAATAAASSTAVATTAAPATTQAAGAVAAPSQTPPTNPPPTAGSSSIQATSLSVREPVAATNSAAASGNSALVVFGVLGGIVLLAVLAVVVFFFQTNRSRSNTPGGAELKQE